MCHFISGNMLWYYFSFPHTFYSFLILRLYVCNILWILGAVENVFPSHSFSYIVNIHEYNLDHIDNTHDGMFMKAVSHLYFISPYVICTLTLQNVKGTARSTRFFDDILLSLGKVVFTGVLMVAQCLNREKQWYSMWIC